RATHSVVPQRCGSTALPGGGLRRRVLSLWARILCRPGRGAPRDGAGARPGGPPGTARLAGVRPATLLCSPARGARAPSGGRSGRTDPGRLYVGGGGRAACPRGGGG